MHQIAFATFHTGDVLGKIEHSTKFALVDKQGYIRGYYSSLAAEGDDESEEHGIPAAASRFANIEKGLNSVPQPATSASSDLERKPVPVILLLSAIIAAFLVWLIYFKGRVAGPEWIANLPAANAIFNSLSALCLVFWLYQYPA